MVTAMIIVGILLVIISLLVVIRKLLIHQSVLERRIKYRKEHIRELEEFKKDPPLSWLRLSLNQAEYKEKYPISWEIEKDFMKWETVKVFFNGELCLEATAAVTARKLRNFSYNDKEVSFGDPYDLRPLLSNVSQKPLHWSKSRSKIFIETPYYRSVKDWDLEWDFND